MLKSFEEFILESAGSYYDSFYIQIKSKKTAEEAINILKKDILARSFRKEHGWDIIDSEQKIIKVYIDDPENEATITKKVKGNHPDLKYTLYQLGDKVEITTTDKEKEQIKYLIKAHFDKKENVLIEMHELFSEGHSWADKYRERWLEAVQEELDKKTKDLELKNKLGHVSQIQDDPYRIDLMNKGFNLMIEAMEAGDLGISPNYLKSRMTVSRFNLF